VTAAIITLAEAVVTDLNAQEFSVDIAAEFAYVPRFDRTGLAEWSVLVVPKTDTRAIIAAWRDSLELTIDIGIYRILSAAIADEKKNVDEALALAEEIKEYLSGLRPTDFSAAACVSIANDPIYSVSDLETGRVFLTVVSPTFRMTRAVR
jgi:hypothetical protein